MYFSVASLITQATETFFCFAMISSDEYTCAGKVTDVRVEGSLLGLRATIPFLVTCTTVHHIGANAKWKSRQSLSLIMGEY